MLARKLSLRVKLEMFLEFTSVFEREIVPLLRRQKGFRDEIVLASPGSRDVLVLSFWETSEDADAYHNSAYKDALTLWGSMIEPGPRVGAPDILHTTLDESHTTFSAGKDTLLCSKRSP